jgi:hypothetical protein
MFKNFFKNADPAAFTPTVAPPASDIATLTARDFCDTVEVIESNFQDTDWDSWADTEKSHLGPI